jgi:site-specific recombinase XerD
MSFWQDLLSPSAPSKQRVVGSNPPRDATKLRQKRRHAALSEVSYNRQVLDSMLLTKTIEHYTNGLYAENKSESTVRIYLLNLNQFKTHVGDLKIGDVTALHVRDFMASRRTKSTYTQHQAFRVLRTFFRWCIAEGFIEKYPMANIKAPELEQKVIQTFTREEIQKMLAVCNVKKFIGARNRAIIALFLDTGMREAELVGLTLNDVDFRGGAIKLKGKGRKERIVHINDKARQSLWKYMLIRDVKCPKTELRLFLSEEMRPFTLDGLRTTITKIGKAAGVKAHCHKFRHSCAIIFLRSGGSLATLQHMLGHTNVTTTMRYLTALNSDDVINSHRAHSPGDQFL